MTRAARVRAALGSLVLLGLGCSSPVQDRVHEVDAQALERIAVAPFQAGSNLIANASAPAERANVLPGPPGAPPSPPLPPGPVSNPQAPQTATAPASSQAADPERRVAPSDAATLATRFVSEAFAATGFEIVPAPDLVRVIEAGGHMVPHGDPRALARIAAEEFGATAVLLGRVDRYREREGGEFGATRPASVGFELTLHAAPGGRKLWSARFDHTQRAVSEDVLRAPRYPGGGSRWLSAAELTRWGATQAAERLLELK